MKRKEVLASKAIQILEPRGGVESIRYHLAPRVKDLNGKVLGLHSNHQPNADLFRDKLESLLTKRFNFAEVIKLQYAPPPQGETSLDGRVKAELQPSSNVRPEVLEEEGSHLARRCDAFVTDIGF